MTKKQCPLGEACDLTTAWMAGAAKAQDQIKAQAAEIERLRGDVEKRRETRMSDDDLIRRGDALYAIAGWEIPSTAISALPAVTQPAPDTAADRISAQAAEIERLRGELAKAVEALRFYAWENEMRLPSEGPWGAGSTDFGSVARDTLAELTGGKDE
jgi:hypothetical protein